MEKNKLRNKNVLVIAEPGQAIDGICSRLRTQGLKIEFVSSGFQAINTVEKSLQPDQTSYNLIILFEDCYDMPHREMLNLIRVNVESKKKLPILSLIKTNADEITELIEEGANDFLIEYDNFNHILEKLSSLV